MNPSILRSAIKKKLIIFVLRALFGPFWVPQTTPTTMILFFSVFYIKKYSYLKFWKVGISFSEKILTKKSQNWPFLAVFLGAFLRAPL
jgi:hypothetical protein